MKYLLGILVIGMVIAGGWYYASLSPLEHKTQTALDDFSRVVATKDRKKIGDALQQLLTDDVKIHLQVTFFSIGHITGSQPVVQDFDKASFSTFLDNILFSLEDYSYQPSLRTFHLSADRKTAAVTWTSQEQGNGKSYAAGSALEMRFTSESSCSGQVLFDGDEVRLEKADCTSQLAMLPKSGQGVSLYNPDTLQKLLQ